MPKKIGLDNLDALCRGATILGSGGGGDPQFLYPLNFSYQHQSSWHYAS